ncbi:MAG: DUF459 domain-containing protein [Roseiarcus sp.]
MLCIALGATSAPAQERPAPNLFELLFGAHPSQPAPAPAPTRALAPAPALSPQHYYRKRDYVPSTSTRAPGAPGGAPVQATFHVQVLGDTLAGSAYDGLVEAFADKPEVAFVNQNRDASGLVRQDYFDWIKYTADAAKAADKPQFVVIMLGINDYQSMHDGADWPDPLSDRWRQRYGQRVEAMVQPYIAQHVPVAWIGLPPMRLDKFNSLAIKLNEIIREHAEKAGAKFIDIFDAFANADGQYDAFGPDIEGQNAKLRESDGIHFTKAGARKVAHFLEAELRHEIEKRNPVSDVAALPPDIEQAADDINAQIRREMGAPNPAPTTPAVNAAPIAPPPRPLAGPILPLTGLPFSPGGALASRETHPLRETPDLTRVMRAGEPDQPVPGRADDFAWPKL